MRVDSLENVGLLRFATAGSVDEGKSTLIGRLLFDAKALFADQLAELERDFDLARVTDGLKAEREQGITIDVAHRYFATPRRRFMIADCPGHAEYTRNAVTGLSHADAVILLVDVRKGLSVQSRRHARLAALLGISTLIVCINKMDLVDFSHDAFRQREAEARAAFGDLGFRALHVLPISALLGTNVYRRQALLDEYPGPALLELLETIQPTSSTEGGGRFPVQLVLRSKNGKERALAGKVSCGSFRPGDEVVVLPQGTRTRIQSIETFDGPLTEALAPRSVSVRLEDEVDVSRGDLIASRNAPPTVRVRFESTLVWMSDGRLAPGSRYLLKAGTRTTQAVVRTVHGALDVRTLREERPTEGLSLNDIGRVEIETSEPVALDAFARHPGNGRFILVDSHTNETVGAGLVAA